MMRWPFMLKRTHARAITAMTNRHDLARILDDEQYYANLSTLRDSYQGLVDNEYHRARTEGQAQVHHWATEVNYNVFYGDHPWNGTQRMRATAALQEAEHQFAPTRTQLEAPES